MFGVIIERPKEADTLRVHEFFDIMIRSTFGANGLGDLKEIIQEEKTYKRSCLREYFESKGRVRYFLVAKLGDEIVGTIEYGPSNEIIRNSDENLSIIKEVGTVYVHPEYQGQGIGKQLLDAIGRSLIEHGHKECVMDSGYQSAQKVWTKKFGRPFLLLKDYWSNGGHHMIWKLRVEQLLNAEDVESIGSKSKGSETQLLMKVLETDIAVCRLDVGDRIPQWALGDEWFSITKTDAELSIVCSAANVPNGVKSESEWVGLKVMGPLGFAMVGILARLSLSLANAGVSIFAISTYDTDYLLVKRDKLDEAVKALLKDGIRFL